MRYWLEYLPVRLIAFILRWLPRPVARACGAAIAILAYWAVPVCARWAAQNLEMAFPEKSAEERERILKSEHLSLGRLLAEVPEVPHLHGGERRAHRHLRRPGELHRGRRPRQRRAVDDGAPGRMGDRASCTACTAAGSTSSSATWIIPCWTAGCGRSARSTAIRLTIRMSSPRDAAGHEARRDRGRPDGHQHDSAAGRLRELLRHSGLHRRGACRVARHTGAAVVPAFTIWDDKLGKYRIRFEPAIPLVITDDAEADTVNNTQNYTAAIETAIRAEPRTVALGASPLEDPSAGRAAALLTTAFQSTQITGAKHSASCD